MYVKSNPHLTILKSMYDLATIHKNDITTLNLLADVLWALEFDLELDDFAYHYLAEMTGMMNANTSEGYQKYKNLIEVKIENLSTQSHE